MNELQEYTASIPDSNPNKAELIRQWKIENKWGQQEVEEVTVKLPFEKLKEDVGIVETVKTGGDAAGAGVEPAEVTAPADPTESTLGDGLSESTGFLNEVGLSDYNSIINNALGASVYEPGSQKAEEGLSELASKENGITLQQIIKDPSKDQYMGVPASEYQDMTLLSSGASSTEEAALADNKNLWNNRNLLSGMVRSAFSFQGVPLSQLNKDVPTFAFDVEERDQTEKQIRNRISKLELDMSKSIYNEETISSMQDEVSELQSQLTDDFGFENFNTINIPSAIDNRIKFARDEAKNAFLNEKNKDEFFSDIFKTGYQHLGYTEKKLSDLQNEYLTASESRKKEIKAEIETIDKELGLGGKLYDKNTGNVVGMDKASQSLIESYEKSEELAETTELDELNSMLLNSSFDLVGIAKDFQSLESTTRKEDLGVFSKKDKALISYIAKNGKLPEKIHNIETSLTSNFGGKSRIAKAFNKAIDKYEIINRALQTNRNPLTAENNEILNEAIDATLNIVGGDISTKRENANLFIDLIEASPLEIKDKNVLKEEWEKSNVQEIARGVPHLVQFVAEVGVAKKLSGNGIAKSVNWASKAFTQYYKGNKYIQAASKSVFSKAGIKGAIEAGEFGLTTALTNVAFDRDESVAGSAASGASMGFGGTLGRAFFKHLNKGFVRDMFKTPLYYLDKSSVYKSVMLQSQSAAGGATAYILGGMIMDPLNYEYHKLQDTFIQEWSKMFILGKLQRGLKTPYGGMQNVYRRYSNDMLKLQNLSYSSKKGADVLGLETSIIKTPEKTSNEQVEKAVQLKTQEVNKKLENKEITKEQADLELRQIQESKLAVENQIGINQAKIEIKLERESGQAPTVGQEYVTMSKLKNGEKLNDRDSRTLSELPPEIILQNMGVAASTGNVQQANVIINREAKIQKMLNGGNGFILTQDGFEAVKQGEYKALDPKLREETYQFLNKKFGLDAELSQLKDMKTSSMSVLELENYKKTIEEKEVELKKYQEGGETYDALQERLQEDALKKYEADIVKSKELAKTNVKGEVVESFTKDEFQKAYDASGLEVKDVKDTVAFTDPNNGNKFINREKALEVRDFSAGTHEDFHAVTLDVFKDSKGNVTEEGVAVIDNVLSSLSPRQQKILKEEVDSRYETDKDKSEWYEENLTVLSELIKDKVITFNKGIGEKLLDIIPLYKKNGFENLEINAETGEGIFEMLRGLAEGSKDAQEAASKFAEKAAKNKTFETKTDTAFESKAKLTPKQDQLAQDKVKEIQELQEEANELTKKYKRYKKDSEGNTLIDKEGNPVLDPIKSAKQQRLERELAEQIKPTIDSFVESRTKALYDPITADNRNNLTRQQFVESMKSDLKTMVVNEFKAKQPLEKFITSRGYLRANNLAKRLGVASVEEGITKRIDDKQIESLEDTSKTPVEEINTDVKLVDNIKIEGKPLSVEFKDKVRGFVTEQLENVDVNSEKFRKQVFKPSKAFVDLIVKDVIGNPKQFREFLNSNPTFYKGLSITDLVAIDDGRVKKGQPRLFTELNRRLTKQSEIEKFMMQGRVPYLTTTQQKAGAVLYNRLNPKVAAVINNFFGSTPQNNSNRKRAIAKAIANKFIAEAAPSTEAFKAKPQLDKAKIAERLQVSQEAKFSEAKKAPKVMDSKNALIISEGYVPVERGKKGVDRTREFVLGVGSDVFGVELMRALIATNKVLSTAGNTAYGSKLRADGTPKPGSGAVGGGYNFISNVEKLLLDYGPGSKNPSPKTIKDTLALIEAGELGDLAVLQKELTATKKEGIYSAKDIAAIKRFIAHKNAKGGGIENNTKDIAEINRGKKLMLYGFRKMYEADKSTFPLIAEVSYSFNSNKNPFRDLATLVGEETGLKKGEKTWEEHMMQFGMYTNEMLKAIKGSDKAWSSFVDWSNNNYYQLKLSKEASNLIDKNFKGAVDPLGNILVDWNAKSQFHPLQIESFKRAVKEGDYSKVIDPMIRAYNEYVSLNPFSIKRLGVTDAKRYLNNVEISKTDQKNLNVQAEAAKLINQVIRSEAGFLKEGDPNYVTRKQAGERLLASENLAEGQEKAAKLANEIMPKEIQYSEPITVQKGINALAKTDKALANGRKLNAPVKKIRVLDFDDTVGITKSNVLYTMPDGKTGKIDAATFAKEAGNMEKLGAEWDFSEFSKVMQGKKGPLFEVMKTIFDKRGGKDLFILTARPSDAAGPIKEFLKSLGVDIPIENITGLGNGAPEAKAGWIVGKAAEGYNDFYFADDHIGNVKAVKEVLSQLDVKSKVQQAKFSKAKTFDTIVNDMIKDSAGIETYKNYSAARAKTVGANKGKFNFLIPASAEDFTGLLYKMLGKGKKGDAQMAFLKTNLLDTYDRAESSVTQAKIAAANDFKALKTNLKTLPTSLSKPTGVGGFTFSHAVRTAIWTAQGMEVPGLSKRDVKELNDFVNNNAELKVFTNELIKIQKGKPYPKPGKDWLGGNITSDIINDINKVNRAEYQQEWRENVDIIFSETNMNKMEAAYGTRWRNAMEDSLRRMKSGSNRPPGGNKATDGILDWLNNSVGAVMFLNTRSALLQTISAVNFINWGDNNIAKAGAAFANQKQYWKDYMTLMNSDYLVERRNGLKINVSESEIADAVRDSGNKPKAAIAFLLSKGFVMTRFADSFAIASGGSTFYRNRIKALVAKGMEQKAAEAQAFEDFRQIAEDSQQSSNPNKISMQQASSAGRPILAWANTPMQYARIQKRAAQDLINGRGDWKTNVSKIVYYGAIQNLIFNSLQQAVFALGFGEDDEEKDAKKNEKISRVANGMIDSQLKGLGIGGAAVLALKSALMELGKQHAEKSPEYEEAVFDLLNFSPPLGSKINKIRGGLRSFSWNMEDMKEKGFSLDNPAYLAGAQVTTGLTNVPLDRVAKKINNVRGMVNEQSALWQKVALGLGWSTWDLGLGYYGGFDAAKVLTAEEEKVKEIDDMKKLTKTKEQVDMLLDLGLSKKEIKALGKEQARVEKIIELQNAEAEPKKEAEVKEEIKEETKPTPVAKPKPTPKPKVKTVSAEARLRRQFDSIKDENKPDQVKTLLKFGLSKKEIRDLKYEKNRVEKILELMPKNK